MAQGDIHFEKRALLENISLDIGEVGGHEAPVVALGIIDQNGDFKAVGALVPLPGLLHGYSAIDHITPVGAEINPTNRALKVYPENGNTKIRVGFESLDTNLWDVTQSDEDIVEAGGNTAGAGYLKISKGLGKSTKSETTLLSKFTIRPPFRLGLGMSLSQRLNQEGFVVEVVGVGDNGDIVNVVQTLAPVAISSIQQATTTLTVTTSILHGLVPGDHVNIYGVSDSRMNLSECIVASVTSATVFTITATTYGTITSLTAGPFNSGYVVKDDPLLSAKDSFAIEWLGSSASNAKYVTRANGCAFSELALTSFGSNNTNPTVGNSGAFCDSLLPTYLYDLKFKNEGVILRTFPADAMTTSSGNVKKSRLVPNIALAYKIRIRAANHQDKTRPIARIVSATKSGSSTVTIVTDVAHGLTTADFVQIYGIRDQTNFANLTTATAVASVVNSTTFTIAIGSSATATSYGGVVIRQTGSMNSGVLAQVAQSISASGGILTIVGNTTWSGIAIGESIHLKGCYDTSGNPLPYDGYYKVASVSTTNLVLYYSGADFGSVNCGGAVFKRTDFLLHTLRIFDYTRFMVDVDSGTGNNTDVQESVPVSIAQACTLSATVANGQAAHDAAITGNPVRLAGRAVTANYTAVATGDVADLITTLVGALIVRKNAIPEQEVNNSQNITDSTDHAVFAGAGAGIRNYLTALQVQNKHATVATTLIIKDGSTAKWTINLPAAMPTPACVIFEDPITMTANTAINVACGTTGADVLFNAQGYKAP